MPHTIKTLTEAELAQAIAEINGGAESIFAPGATIKTADMTIEISANQEGAITDVTLQPKKRRGRPPGSKSKKKNVSAT